MNFDTLAPIYRLLEWVLAGSELQTCRTAWLERLPLDGRVLVLGEGPGRLLEVIAARFPLVQLTVIDSSPAMLSRAQQSWNRLPEAKARVVFIEADGLSHAFPALDYSAIITPFFLDCFSEPQLRSLVPRLAEALTPNGVWLISDFAVPDHSWAKHRARVIHWMMYGFFHYFIGIPARYWTNPAPLLMSSGLVESERMTFNHGLLVSSVWRKTSGQ